MRRGETKWERKIRRWREKIVDRMEEMKEDKGEGQDREKEKKRRDEMERTRS